MKNPIFVVALVAIILAVTVTASGCVSPGVPVIVPPPKLPTPVEPVLPAVSVDAISCLTDDAYEALVTREVLLRTWAESCAAIIGATQRPL